jgi:hypothetical protein
MGSETVFACVSANLFQNIYYINIITLLRSDYNKKFCAEIRGLPKEINIEHHYKSWYDDA